MEEKPSDDILNANPWKIALGTAGGLLGGPGLAIAGIALGHLLDGTNEDRMNLDWADRFRAWSRPPSDTEEEKADRAARMVKQALQNHRGLQSRDFDVIAIGSNRNNTNTRASSDVDLAAVLKSAHYSSYPANGVPNRETFGFSDATYGLEEFRRDVSSALRQHFGSPEIEPGKIALTVDEGSARLGADATPYLPHRRYTGTRNSRGWEYHEGIETRPVGTPSLRLIQWPGQHYAEGVSKNERTGRRFKRVVRILKSLRDLIQESGTAEARQLAGQVRSCFIEYCVSNVPDDRFGRSADSYYDDVKAVVSWLWNSARSPEQSANLLETSRMNRLFRPEEEWTPKLLEEFTLLVWRTVGFK